MLKFWSIVCVEYLNCKTRLVSSSCRSHLETTSYYHMNCVKLYFSVGRNRFPKSHRISNR